MLKHIGKLEQETPCSYTFYLFGCMDDGSRKNDDDAMSHPTSKGRRNGGRGEGRGGRGLVRGLRPGVNRPSPKILAAIEANYSSSKGFTTCPPTPQIVITSYGPASWPRICEQTFHV